MRVVIACWAAKLPTGIHNAKNYHAWPQLVALLNAEGHEVIQVAGRDEERVEGVATFLQAFPLDKLEQVLREADCWVSIDSWMPHFCATMRLKSGIVLWSQSDPRIWGYKHNINLHKPEYLRPWQYAPWYDVAHNADAFVEPQVVMDALHGRLAQVATT